ncbi:leucyl aminopeptidase [Protofrankia sp. BMG5.30]|uniref:leucyl aminopeptidase n=1 Tax=Protofrankia sp. BMG5.30 TaxID=1834514 RepID=UPI0009782B4D|nr:leucyl aminopeptidase [Protofrankia sp. BMG5.30]ONH37178.1 leucyl aminopeptidase [Protofrankia sp. BMG5.30]
MTVTAVTTSSVLDLDADVLVIGVATGKDGPIPLGGTEELDTALGGRLATVLADLGATGKAGDLVRFATLGTLRIPTVLAVGVGAPPSQLPATGPSPAGTSAAGADAAAADGGIDHETLRRAAGAAVRALAGTTRVATTLALVAGSPGPARLRAVAEGSLLGAYAFREFRTTSADDHRPPVSEITFVVDSASRAAADDAVRRAGVVADSVALVRDLVNTPPGHLPPAAFAEIAARRAGEVGVTVDVLDEQALADGEFGGILGVGQGSANTPRLVRLEWRPAGSPATGGPALTLVGKGITFDSGGLSLKPPTAMEWMKADMAGAASVLATLVAAARLNLPVHLAGWLPLAENMPSGGAIRPGDVLALRGGTRVEVLNTDAEGRLVLGDALARAAEDSPALIVDVATLTGAQIVALGQRTAGVMGRGGAVDQVVDAARDSGEAVWPMPLPPELRKVLDSTVADLANVAGGGGRDGGMLVGAHFLSTFVPEDIPWAHIDIAGPSWNGGEPYGHTPRGGTGAIVRTLLQLAENVAGNQRPEVR